MTGREVANEDENEYSDPDTAAEQVPRVPIWLLKKAQPNYGPLGIATLRVVAFSREGAEEHGGRDRMIGGSGERLLVELPDAAWNRKHLRGPSTRAHPGWPGLPLAQDDRSLKISLRSFMLAQGARLKPMGLRI
jgi:hypothetical protein